MTANAANYFEDCSGSESYWSIAPNKAVIKLGSATCSPCTDCRFNSLQSGQSVWGFVGQTDLKLCEPYQGIEQFRNYSDFYSTKEVAISLELVSQGLTVSFRSINYPDHFIRHRNGEAWLDANDGSELFKLDASWRVVPGLANPNAVSFESVNYPGEYLRHANGLLYKNPNDHSELFHRDATFYPRKGLSNPEYNSFESFNFPGSFIRHQGYRIKISPYLEQELFKNDATFSIIESFNKN